MIYQIKDCSLIINKTIIKRNFNKPNPLLDRKMKYPLNKLEVGKSLWFECDLMSAEELRVLRMSVNRYNVIYSDLFTIIKHRGDMRKTGFKYLEIGRVR